MIPGLAVQRTVLAWTRTWLTAGGCALLLVRLGGGSRGRIAAILAVDALTVLAATAAGRRRATRLRRSERTGAPPDPAVRAVAVIAATTSLLGLAAAVLVALH